MKVYDQCPPSVHDRVNAMVAKYHQELQVAEVAFDLLFIARSDDDESTEPVLKLHGYPCMAVARIVPSKERAKGCGDAEIVIDRDRYTNLPPEKQDALLDHELQHFEVQRDNDGGIKTDDQHRPKLGMRHHDYDFGWFECIARRHGPASIEVQQAEIIHSECGQIFFPFIESGMSNVESGKSEGAGTKMSVSVG